MGLFDIEVSAYFGCCISPGDGEPAAAFMLVYGIIVFVRALVCSRIL